MEKISTHTNTMESLKNFSDEIDTMYAAMVQVASSGGNMQQLRQQINRRVWEQLITVAKGAVVRGGGKTLDFTIAEKDFLDFGFLPLNSLDLPPDISDEFSEYRKEAVRCGLRLLHQHLEDAFYKARKSDQLDRLSLDVNALEQDSAKLFAGIETVRNMRAKFIEGTFQKDMRFRLEQINTAMDDCVWTMIHLDFKRNHGGLATHKERAAYVELKTRMANGDSERKSLLEKCVGGHKVRMMNLNVSKLYTKAYDISRKLAEKRFKLKELAEEIGRISMVDVEIKLEDELKSLRSFAQMAARTAKIPPFALFVKPESLPAPSEVRETFDHILSFDPGLFNNRHAKTEGKPALMFFPGCGTGTYDWSQNRLLLPTQPVGDLIPVLSHAAVAYRCDIDAQKNERELMTSFQKDIKENHGIRSTRALRDTLVDAYVHWISREALGYGSLDKETRRWFEDRIGPSKRRPIMPPEVYNMTMAEAAKRAEALGAKEQLASDEMYMLALYKYICGEYENALILFTQIQKDCPDLSEAYYSAAMTCAKLKRSGVRDLLEQFIKTAPQSWWVKKAQEIIRKLKSF